MGKKGVLFVLFDYKINCDGVQKIVTGLNTRRMERESLKNHVVSSRGAKRKGRIEWQILPPPIPTSPSHCHRLWSPSVCVKLCLRAKDYCFVNHVKMKISKIARRNTNLSSRFNDLRREHAIIIELKILAYLVVVCRRIFRNLCKIDEK